MTPIEFQYVEEKLFYNITLLRGIYQIEAWGADGGSNDACAGGKGGYASIQYIVRSAKELFVYVGSKGEYLNTKERNATGGYNGGGNGYSGTTYSYNSGGGGSSDVRLNSSLASRIVVAGGGGGIGYRYRNCLRGGAGGGYNGSPGEALVNYSANAGGGGTQKEGGLLGYDNANIGNSGRELYGGDGIGIAYGGGGGGGGLYGGGGAYEAGGGGGSSFAPSYFNGITISGDNETIPQSGANITGNGFVRITMTSPLSIARSIIPSRIMTLAMMSSIMIS